MGLRAVYEVPSRARANGKAFVVGDIEIGGRPISWGGQIAERVTMGLTGVATRKGGDPQPRAGLRGVPERAGPRHAGGLSAWRPSRSCASAGSRATASRASARTTRRWSSGASRARRRSGSGWRRWSRRSPPPARCSTTTGASASCASARGEEPAELVATWRNVAFSAAGLRRLVGAGPVAAFHDEAFREGLPARARACSATPTRGPAARRAGASAAPRRPSRTWC